MEEGGMKKSQMMHPISLLAKAYNL
jgi:hypothetical protein